MFDEVDFVKFWIDINNPIRVSMISEKDVIVFEANLSTFLIGMKNAWRGRSRLQAEGLSVGWDMWIARVSVDRKNSDLARLETHLPDEEAQLNW